MISIDNLACSVAAAKEKSITKAAKKMFLSRSIVSRRISTLEDELGMSLFVRTDPSMKLSGAGKFLLERGTAILQEISELETTLVNQQVNAISKIRICCVSLKDEFFDSLRTSMEDRYIIASAFSKANIAIESFCRGSSLIELAVNGTKRIVAESSVVDRNGINSKNRRSFTRDNH